MKFFKLILPLIPIFLLILGLSLLFLNLNKTPSPFFNPISQTFQNDFRNLTKLLNQNQISYDSDISINDSLGKIFLTIIQNGRPIDVILSTEKDPLFQTAALQKILKLATIKNKQVTFIDLSLKRPYATLKDN